MNPTQHIVVLKQAQKTRIPYLPLTLCIAVGVVCLAVMFSGCASNKKPPTQALQRAELAIKNAEQARVADYASPELTEAREKLTAARLAVEKKEMVAAQRFAELAAVDADLATAKAGAAKAKAVNDEMLKSTSTLKQEMQRNSGAQ